MPQNNEFSQSSGRIYQNLLDGSALQTKTLGTLSTRKPTPQDTQAFEDTIEHFKQKIQKIKGVSNAFENFEFEQNAERMYMRMKNRLLKIDYRGDGRLKWIKIRYATPPKTVAFNGISLIQFQYDDGGEKMLHSISRNNSKENINRNREILDILLQESLELENDSDYKVTLQHHIGTTISCTPEGYLCH